MLNPLLLLISGSKKAEITYNKVRPLELLKKLDSSQNELYYLVRIYQLSFCTSVCTSFKQVNLISERREDRVRRVERGDPEHADLPKARGPRSGHSHGGNWGHGKLHLPGQQRVGRASPSQRQTRNPEENGSSRSTKTSKICGRN